MLRLRRPLVLVAAACMMLAAAIVVVVVARDSVDCQRYRFDASAWRAARAAGRDGEERIQEDAKAIARCGVFIGQPVTALRAQLGKPTVNTPEGWSYTLAEDSGTGLAWLDFTFDRSRRVVSASVSTI